MHTDKPSFYYAAYNKWLRNTDNSTICKEKPYREKDLFLEKNDEVRTKTNSAMEKLIGKAQQSS